MTYSWMKDMGYANYGCFQTEILEEEQELNFDSLNLEPEPEQLEHEVRTIEQMIVDVVEGHNHANK